MFLFVEDQFESPPSIILEAYYPIKASFSAQMKGISPITPTHSIVTGARLLVHYIPHTASQGSRCQVLLHNGQGSSLEVDLPSDGRTAVFISQLNTALHQFSEFMPLVFIASN